MRLNLLLPPAPGCQKGRRGLVQLLGVLTVSAVAGLGCGSGADLTPQGGVARVESQASPQALFEEWEGLVLKPEANMENPRCAALAAMFTTRSPGLANAMVDLLADAGTSPKSKVLILQSLESALQPDIVPRLLELTKPGVDGTLRAGIPMVLARVKDPKVTERLRELTDDSDQRVRLGAINALVLRGDREARKKLQDMFARPDLPAPFRERIALTIAATAQPGDAAILSEALGAEGLHDSSRVLIAGALGMLADPAALPALNACIEGNGPENLKSMARDAVAAIHARHPEDGAPDSSAG